MGLLINTCTLHTLPWQDNVLYNTLTMPSYQYFVSVSPRQNTHNIMGCFMYKRQGMLKARHIFHDWVLSVVKFVGKFYE